LHYLRPKPTCCYCGRTRGGAFESNTRRALRELPAASQVTLLRAKPSKDG